MYETYELYLIDTAGARKFAPLTCFPEDLVKRAREEMRRAGAAACDIEQFRKPLLSLQESAEA